MKCVRNYKKMIRVSGFDTGHVQGIAVDEHGEYLYVSFTTCLVKTDMEGRVVGTVKGLAGHLGCIAYCKEDGRIYGSLEYKHDVIGSDILKKLDSPVDVTDGFYIAIFDVSKIDRMDMDAEQDGVMTAVYLNEVLKDYQAPGHRYGCSGIDGVTFAPEPGNPGGEKYLYVAYGIYEDLEREDNDHQVILRYDTEQWAQYEKVLNQADMHRQGPEEPDDKYFVYTGNTRWGIQNLEYDEDTNCMFAAVYHGSKPQYPNYPMYVINLNGEDGRLCLASFGQYHGPSGIRGYDFPYGSTGMISLGGGYFYMSRDFQVDGNFGTDIGLYRFERESGFVEAE